MLDSTIIAATIGGVATILASLLAVFFARNKPHSRHSGETSRSSSPGLPDSKDDSDLVLDVVRNGPYIVRRATSEDIQWIAIKAQELYGEDDSIPLDVKTSWFKKNPNGFWVVINRYGSCVGSCELLPISCRTLDRLRSGATREKDITPEDILAPGKEMESNILYLENFMSVNEGNIANQWAFKEFLIFLKDIAADLGVEVEQAKVYAMPVREYNSIDGPKRSNSERILKELGFYKIVHKTVQGYPLYCGELKSILQSLLPMRQHYFKPADAQHLAQSDPKPRVELGG